MSKQSHRLPFLDSTFLRIETSDTPVHVGMLMEFAIPEAAGPGFIANVVAELPEARPLRPPFNQVLGSGLVSRLAPAARTIETVDMEYHLRHTALAIPRRRTCFGLADLHLHGTVLDRSRSLWTCHVIEGLDQTAVDERVTLSNVPGPAEARYLAGARMDACYPVSLLFQGLGLNITCISFVGGRRFSVGG